MNAQPERIPPPSGKGGGMPFAMKSHAIVFLVQTVIFTVLALNSDRLYLYAVAGLCFLMAVVFGAAWVAYAALRCSGKPGRLLGFLERLRAFVADEPSVFDVPRNQDS